LIAAIDAANKELDVSANQPRDLLLKARAEKQNYKELYHQALNRELMLLDRLARLEKELARFSNVVPIRE
jgi:hypothetical protein